MFKSICYMHIARTRSGVEFRLFYIPACWLGSTFYKNKKKTLNARLNNFGKEKPSISDKYGLKTEIVMILTKRYGKLVTISSISNIRSFHFAHRVNYQQYVRWLPFTNQSIKREDISTLAVTSTCIEREWERESSVCSDQWKMYI